MIIGTALKIGDLVLAVQEESHDFLIHQAGALGIKDAEDKIQMYENYGYSILVKKRPYMHLNVDNYLTKKELLVSTMNGKCY